MATTTRRLTVEDLELLPEERPGDRHELIDGELIVTPVPILKHQTISSNLIFALEQHVRERRLGIVRSAPTGVRLTLEDLLIPDACYVARDRLEIHGEKTIDGPPDLVFEILSPGSRQRDLTVKRDLYARFGVAEYWIVDPLEESVLVLTLVEGTYQAVAFGEDGAIQSHVLPELLLIEDVFADAM